MSSQGATPPEGRQRDSQRTIGVIALCLGLLGCCVGGCLGVAPFPLIGTGDSADTEKLADLSAALVVLAVVVLAMSTAPLALGAYLLLRRRR